MQATVIWIETLVSMGLVELQEIQPEAVCPWEILAQQVVGGVHNEETPFGIDLHGGKIHGGLPGQEEVTGAPTGEIEGYVDVLGGSIGIREKEYRDNKMALVIKSEKDIVPESLMKGQERQRLKQSWA